MNLKTYTVSQIKQTDDIRGWKICNSCDKQLTLDNFRIDKRFNLYETICNSCSNQRKQLYKKQNKEKIKITKIKYYYKIKNTPKYKLQKKQRELRYRIKNRLKENARIRKYRRNRNKIDPAFRLLRNLRTRIHHALNGRHKKSQKTKDLIGCDINFLLKYIESKFKDGMNWQNIHVHHIAPCQLFDFSKESHQKACFHYSNLEPLFIKNNIIKSDYLENGKRARDLSPQEKQIELTNRGYGYLFS